MAAFQYEAMDAGGKSVKGTVDAVNLQDAAGKLKGMGYFVTSCSPAKAASAATKGKQPDKSPKVQGKDQTKASAKKKGGGGLNISIGSGGIKAKELMIITRQLATLIGSGLPLLRSIRVLRDQRKPPASSILERVAEDIESGSLFSEALGKYPKSFPKIYVSMVKAGEAGGALETVLIRLAEFMEQEAKLMAKIKSAMAYPMVIMVVTFGLLSFIMLKIVPTFAQIFKDMDAGSLPGPTKLLMSISDMMLHRFYILVIAVIALAITFKILNRIPAAKYWIDYGKMKAPVFGPVIEKTITARFARTFSTLITSGVPILQSLQIVRDTVGNEVISRAINEIRNRVREGEGISGTMMRTGAFPPMVTNMLAVGEETGAIDQMLEKVADAYEMEVDAAVSAMTSMIEPILIVFMGAIVGFIVIALFLPLIALAMNMSGDGGKKE